MSSSLRTVAMFRAVPAPWADIGRPARVSSTASSLRPKPSGVCRNRARPAYWATSRLPFFATVS